MADVAFDPDKYLAEKSPQLVAQNSFDPDKYLSEKTGQSEDTEQPGLLKQAGLGALQVAGKVGRFIDKYTGAPMRAGLYDAQAGNNPIPAALKQFGQDPEQAPTGKQIVMRAGITDDKSHLSDALPIYADKGSQHPWYQPEKGGMLDPTPAGAAGVAMDVAANPLNFVGPAGEAASAISKTQTGSKAIGLIGKGAAKIGEAATGIPEQEIATYAKNADEIAQMAKSSDGNVAQAADSLRQKWSTQVKQFKQAQNDQIAQTLANSDKAIDAQPILDSLDAQKARINQKLNPEQIQEIDFLKSKVGAVADENWQIPVKDAHDLKNYLQEAAEPSYSRNGQIFQRGQQAQIAAKSGAAVTRQAISEAEPAVAQANTQLAKLHDIEDNLNRNLLVQGKPESSILSAGADTPSGQRNENFLEKLDTLTGSTTKQDAQKLAAMRTFANPKLLPIDATGKATTRAGLLTSAGYLLGGKPGAIAAGTLTSPMAVKGIINAGKLAADNEGAAGAIGRAAAANKVLDLSGQNPVYEQLLKSAQKKKSSEDVKASNQ